MGNAREVFVLHVRKHLKDERRHLPLSEAVLHRMLDIIEFERTIVIFVPAGKMLLDKLVQWLLLRWLIGLRLGVCRSGSGNHQEHEQHKCPYGSA